MLSIGKLGVGQERYYLDRMAEGAEDYYTGEGEAPGEWTGDAAAPKSASLLWALGGPHATLVVSEAHQAAVGRSGWATPTPGLP